MLVKQNESLKKKERESRITTRTLIERVYWANSGKPPVKQRIFGKNLILIVIIIMVIYHYRI